MKILHVSCGGLGNGGVQAVIMGICRHLPDVQFDIILFTLEKRYYDDQFKSLGGSIFRIPRYEGRNRFKRILNNLSMMFRIPIQTYKILKKYGPYDAIHCHNHFESGLCNVAARMAGVKVRISHSHNTAPPGKRRFTWRIYEWVLKYLITNNSNVQIGCSRQALKYLFGNSEKAYVINNAINLNYFNKELYPYKKHETINFIHVGRYSSEKNQLFLLDIINHLKKEIGNIQLTMIGFGEDEEIVAEKVIRLGLEKNVKMLPSDTNIPQQLSKTDYFIFPSNFEGLGIVLLEAQAMGVKCIASSNVPPEANMGLCDYLDLQQGPEEWAKYILKLINNKSNRQYPLDHVLKNYDIENISKNYKEIYSGAFFEN